VTRLRVAELGHLRGVDMIARILIADDNPHVRHALRTLLEHNPEWEVCGEAVDGRDAVSKAQQLSPDLIVLDFLMPGLNGLEAAREIHKSVPSARMLMCTMYLSRQLTEVAKNSGVRGAVPKTGINQLTRGIEAVLRDETFFDLPAAS
jgi:DNA-binding NarL/FixJ family response regulator